MAISDARKFKPVFIDLFAGAGGMSVGFEEAGFELAAATDWDRWSCETLRKNHTKNVFIYEGDITKIKLSEFRDKLFVKDIDLIIGGPPCQGFSQLGKRLENDPRNKLWQQYMNFIEFFNPKLFVMENVPQILTSEEYVSIKKIAEKLGYDVREKILHAVDYGVPQKRKRAFIIGSRIGIPEFPQPTHIAPDKKDLLTYGLKSWCVVKDAIGDLPRKPDNRNWHIGRNPTPMSLARYKAVPAGGNRFDLPRKLMPECWKNKPTGSTDVFGRLEWDKPALTIRTEFFKPEKGRYLHPKEHRPITIREAARLQTFPDDYILMGSAVQVAKQVGNAVPPRLAKAIGSKLLHLLQAGRNSRKQQFVNRFALSTSQRI